MAGLYIHVPFCHAKCRYCDFYSMSSFEKADGYLQLIQREWELRRGEIDSPETIYFGGGTPSILPLDRVSSLRTWLPDVVTEFTVEVNPEDVTPAVAATWRDVGANRVSMGVQSLSDAELQSVGRRHSALQAVQAFKTLRNSGFDNISVDVIIALPGQTRATLADTVRRLLDLGPEHFSAYILSYEPGTLLWTQRRLGRITETDEDTVAAMYLDVCNLARSYGYEHYEVSNFALPGCRARHNSAYWDDKPYLGLGPSAHSFDGVLRRANPANLKAWAQAVTDRLPAFTVEDETVADRVNDRIMVTLRTSKGLDLQTIPQPYREQVQQSIARLAPGRVLTSGDTIRIPEAAWLVSDDTIASLFVE